MVNLDSPVLTLGALFLAGNSAQGREFTGGESGTGLLAGGFAAASSDAAVTEIRNRLGVQPSSLSDELAQALLGAGVSWTGRRFDGVPTRLTNPAARGIMYDVASQGFEGAGFTLGEFLNGGGTQAMHRQVQSSPSPQSIHTGGASDDMEVI